MATSVLSWSQAIAYQRLSGEDIGGIDMTAVWEGMALQQGHKSCSWQSHCQHSSTSADKGLCSPPNTHDFWWGAKRVQSQSAVWRTQNSNATLLNVRGKRLRRGESLNNKQCICCSLKREMDTKHGASSAPHTSGVMLWSGATIRLSQSAPASLWMTFKNTPGEEA